jgi:hypothetical protein
MLMRHRRNTSTPNKTAKSAELLVEQLTKLELLINLKTATALGHGQAADRTDESASYYYTYEDRHQRLDIPLP